MLENHWRNRFRVAPVHSTRIVDSWLGAFRVELANKCTASNELDLATTGKPDTRRANFGEGPRHPIYDKDGCRTVPDAIDCLDSCQAVYRNYLMTAFTETGHSEASIPASIDVGFRPEAVARHLTLTLEVCVDPRIHGMNELAFVVV
jgi:hypothetical protein